MTANKLRQMLEEATAALELIEHKISYLEMQQDARLEEIMILQEKLDAAEFAES